MLPPEINFVKASNVYFAFLHDYATRHYLYYKTILFWLQKQFLLKKHLLFLVIITTAECDSKSRDMLPPLKSLILKWGLLAQWLYRAKYLQAILACPAIFISPVTDFLLCCYAHSAKILIFTARFIFLTLFLHMNDFNHRFLNNMFSFYYYNTIPTREQVFSFSLIKFFWAFMLRSTIHLPPIEEGEFLLYFVKYL